jgi:hypothetical protein
MYAAADPVANERRWSDVCDRIIAALTDVKGVRAMIVRNWGSVPSVLVTLGDRAQTRRVALCLDTGEPRIVVGTMRLRHAGLAISLYSMRDDEVEPFIRRFRTVLEEVIRGD